MTIERTVLLLRDVFDLDYHEISELVGKTEAACRQQHKRVRNHISTRKRSFIAAVTPQGSESLHQEIWELNGEPAIIGDSSGKGLRSNILGDGGRRKCS